MSKKSNYEPGLGSTAGELPATIVRDQKQSTPSTTADIVRSCKTIVTPDDTVFINLPPDRWYTSGSDAVRNYFAAKLYEVKGKAPKRQEIEDLQTSIEGQARLDGMRGPVALRAGGDQTALHVDLGSDSGEVIEVTRDGWRIVATSPIPFTRSLGMLPLPMPTRGGSIDELRDVVNVGPGGQLHMATAWLLSCFMPTGPYPILMLQGEQGSAKSTTARNLKALVDPHSTALRPPLTREDDLRAAVRQSRVLAFDNVSQLSPSMSDALCRVSTGATLAKRKLYSNADEHAVNACASVLLNGIPDLAGRGDLADRSIVLQLAPIDKSQRRTEAEVKQEFEKLAPRILGVLLDATVTALHDLASVQIKELPRMADFARWVTAAESAFGWKPGTILAAYDGNQNETIAENLDTDPVAVALRSLLEKKGGSIDATPTQLLDSLRKRAGDGGAQQLPKNPRALSDALKRLTPGLRRMGVIVSRGRSSTKRTISITGTW